MLSNNTKSFFYISKKQYFSLLVFLLICFFSYYYVDIESTTRHGINVWKSLFEGKFLQFYTYNADPSLFNAYHQAIYEIPLYLLFAIWDLPLYIVEIITKSNSLSFIPCILYSKGILILFLWLTIKTLCKICDASGFSQEKKEACVFLWISSFFVIEPLFVICQYDIICLFLILNGILSYLKKDDKMFIIWFAAAIPFKIFALFVFLPLLLIKEKNIFKIILASICCLAPLLFFKLIFIITDPEYSNLPEHPAIKYLIADAQYFEDCYLNRHNTLHLPMGNPTVFLTLFTGFIAVCYFFINKTDTFITLFLPTVSFSLLFIFSWLYPYWIIFISPFIALLCFYSQSKFIIYKNLVLELIFSGAFTFAIINKFYYFFNSSSLLHLLLKYKLFKIIPEKFSEISDNYPFNPTGWKYEIQKLTSISEYITVPITVAVFSVFLILFLIHVYFDYKKPDNSDSQILFKTLNPFFLIRTLITGFISIAQILFILFARIRM